MTYAALISEWNTNGCRGCVAKFDEGRMNIYRRVWRLRAEGHYLKEWPRDGAPVKRKHVDICNMTLTRTLKQVAEATGLRVDQVRYSVRRAMR